MTSKKKALGRGLDAILQSPETDITSRDISGDYVAGAVAEIEIGKIEANPFQPRTDFEAESMEELARSIGEQGIIQPLTVRKAGFDRYQLIAGERRLKASKMAGLSTVPCYIRVANDEQMLELALIENIHRKDLNAIEIGISYQRLIEELNLTQEEVSKKVGKDRATISNYIRLLKLPVEVQYALRNDQISMGHARTLIGISDEEKQLKTLLKIVEKGLSVREAEKLAREIQAEPAVKEPALSSLPEHLQEAGLKLHEKIGAAVRIKSNTKGAGSLVIKFGSGNELERILKLLNES
ncbi:MAG TPA: ParB/RepB/Spo0J family partition protein [Bacteroidales bacterium]|nr:ParB/RepB/Spo0J family partition protein [Bacteroidales bacterium]HPI86265.1 ParB/RepB/Spo0J family partition protein [Bacteroidales bacterium]HPM93662.1 ParB/RepB/Spo0J family partition protein [Bacteroidales bacterium]